MLKNGCVRPTPVSLVPQDPPPLSLGNINLYGAPQGGPLQIQCAKASCPQAEPARQAEGGSQLPALPITVVWLELFLAWGCLC